MSADNTEGSALKAEDKSVAVNVNAGGKVHRLSAVGATLPQEKRRARCGWRAGSAVAKTMFCKRAVAGSLCRKCFRDHGWWPGEGEVEDAIEEPD